MDDHAGPVVVEVPIPEGGETMVRKRPGVIPVAAPDRDDGALRGRSCDGRRRPRVQPDLDSLRQDRIGTFVLAVEQPRKPLQRQRRRAPLAPGSQTL
jgi:hypothetical protein